MGRLSFPTSGSCHHIPFSSAQTKRPRKVSPSVADSVFDFSTFC
jgi:hypothetical protein